LFVYSFLLLSHYHAFIIDELVYFALLYVVIRIESPEYFGLDMIVGESVELLCNTSLTSDTMWTYDDGDDDGYVDYIYWNGHTDGDKPRLSVKSTADNFHILVITDAEPKYSGLYDCYDARGTREVGYQLTIAGTKSVFRY